MLNEEKIEHYDEIKVCGGLCSLCGRSVSYLTRHHLIPRARHNKYAKKLHSTDELRHTSWFCRDCHRMTHALMNEKELERNFNTIELLKTHPQVEKYLRWIKNKPENSVTKAKRSNNW